MAARTADLTDLTDPIVTDTIARPGAREAETGSRATAGRPATARTSRGRAVVAAVVAVRTSRVHASTAHPTRAPCPSVSTRAASAP